MELYEEFVDPHTGMPMVRIYQQHVPVPVKGSVGNVVTFRVEEHTFHGVIKQNDGYIAIIALG